MSGEAGAIAAWDALRALRARDADIRIADLVDGDPRRFAEAFDIRHPDAYERLLMDVVRGNQTLFMRRDEVEAAWAWIDPILGAWARAGEAPKPYTAGSWGPSAAVALIERDGRTWNEDAS